MDSEEMFQWTKELKEIEENLKMMKDEFEYKKEIVFELDVREKHLNRIRNLSPWQLSLIDEKIRKEAGVE